VSPLRSGAAVALLAPLCLFACGAGEPAAPVEPEGVPELPRQLSAFDPDVASAVERAHASLSAYPDDLGQWAKYGMVLQANRLFTEALAVYERTLEQLPSHARTHYRRALCLWELGRADEALDAVAEAGRLAPGPVFPVWRLGLWRLQRGELEAAERAFGEALERGPGHAASRLGLARVHLQRDEAELALRLLVDLVEERPEDGYARELLRAARRELGHEGREFRTHRDKSFEPDWDDGWETEIVAYRVESPLKQAIRHLSKGRPGRALSLLEAELAENPEDVVALENLATAQRMLGDVRAAAGALERVLELQPRRARALLEYAELQVHLEAPDEALAALGRVLELEPRDREAHRARSRLLFAEGRYAEAVPALEEALALSPDNRRYLYWLAVSQMRSGDLDAARRSFRRARELNPDDPAVLLGCAEVHLAAGEPERAAVLLREAAELEGVDRAELERLGQRLREGAEEQER